MENGGILGTGTELGRQWIDSWKRLENNLIKINNRPRRVESGGNIAMATRAPSSTAMDTGRQNIILEKSDSQLRKWPQRERNNGPTPQPELKMTAINSI